MGESAEMVYVSLEHLIRLQFRAAGFSFLPRQPVASLLSGRHASRLRGRGLDFDELRHYRPGDDIRTLDWKVTNRTGKPHVRCYREEREREVLLLVDQRLSMFFGSRIRMKSVVAAELAALACWRVVNAGDRCGALVFNDQQIAEHKPRRNRSAVMQLLGKVAAYNRALRTGHHTYPAPEQLNRVLGQAERLVSHDGLVVLISDLNGWNQETLQRLKRLSRHNDVITGLVFDRLERQLPKVGELVASDGRSQIQFDAKKDRLAQRYETDFEGSVDFLQAELRTHAVPVIPLDTEGAVDQQLRRAIGDAAR